MDRDTRTWIMGKGQFKMDNGRCRDTRALRLGEEYRDTGRGTQGHAQ